MDTMTMPLELHTAMLEENEKRLAVLNRKYNPLTGENAPGMRAEVILADYLGGESLYLPVEMFNENLVCALVNCGSIRGYILKYLPEDTDYETTRETVFRMFTRLRCKHDFYFFAYAYGRIKNKDGGPDIPFLLRPAQIKLVKVFEEMRLSGTPIRVLLLKCRQWGGSTATDVYMAYIQLFWRTNWDSNIVGHQSTSSSNVFAMYERLINSIPLWMFYEPGEDYPADAKKFAGVGTSQNIKRMVPRECNIQTGSARNPESTRSASAAMVHLTEEAFFPSTEQWTPAKVVNSAISSVQVVPYSFVVRESTPNGKNAFYDEWQRTKTVNPATGRPMSAYRGVFVAWFEIEKYLIPMTEDERADFLIELYKNRHDKQYGGEYHWWLWQKGASLEGIKWYMEKSLEYSDLEDMKQEYPSDDIEAFKYSGCMVFDAYKLDELEGDCMTPVFVGDIEGDSLQPENLACMDNLHLVEQPGGPLRIFEHPDTEEVVQDRYLVAVDIGGAYKTSDYHDIVVLDRYDLMFGGVPAVVAEWHGHCDADQLAMRCAQIAQFYCDAFLVVENNTAYSKMNKTDGDISQMFFPILLPLYDNLYSSNHSKALKRRQKETKWGFNTNKSTKESLINNYRRVVRTHGYIEREHEALVEMGYYLFYSENGTYGAAAGYHDDRVMARAIALYVSMLDMDTPRIVKEKTLAELRAERIQALTQKTSTVIGNL